MVSLVEFIQYINRHTSLDRVLRYPRPRWPLPILLASLLIVLNQLFLHQALSKTFESASIFKMGARGLIAVGVPPQPRWLLVVKGLMIFLSVIVLALSAYALSLYQGYYYYGGSGVPGYLIFLVSYHFSKLPKLFGGAYIQIVTGYHNLDYIRP